MGKSGPGDDSHVSLLGKYSIISELFRTFSPLYPPLIQNVFSFKSRPDAPRRFSSIFATSEVSSFPITKHKSERSPPQIKGNWFDINSPTV